MIPSSVGGCLSFSAEKSGTDLAVLATGTATASAPSADNKIATPTGRRFGPPAAPIHCDLVGLCVAEISEIPRPVPLMLYRLSNNRERGVAVPIPPATSILHQ